MKKKSFFLLIIIFFLILLVAACKKEEEEKEFIYIRSSAVGGSWYTGSTAWAKLITENTKFTAVNIASPGLTVENITKIAADEAHLAFVNAFGAYTAYKGEGIWRNPVEIRALFGIWAGIHNIIVDEKSGIKDIYGLKGKSIATYVDGDLTGDAFIELLAMHGVTPENTRIHRVMKNDGTRMFIDKRIDCIIYAIGHAHTRLKEITMSKNIRFILGDTKHIETWLEKYPYYSYRAFGSEFGIEDNYQFGFTYFAICLASLPEDQAYLFTKVWYESWDYLMEALPAHMPSINKQNPMEGIPIPIHPGAERYFKEIGLM